METATKISFGTPESGTQNVDWHNRHTNTRSASQLQKKKKNSLRRFKIWATRNLKLHSVLEKSSNLYTNVCLYLYKLDFN